VFGCGAFFFWDTCQKKKPPIAMITANTARIFNRTSWALGLPKATGSTGEIAFVVGNGRLVSTGAAGSESLLGSDGFTGGCASKGSGDANGDWAASGAGGDGGTESSNAWLTAVANAANPAGWLK